ncbi:cilia- and flagella-associated protein 157-like [Epinephelus fuscoguttatus]|uniref:cilia- and flagella-associated protein 157-like n=1 Tax=Epinephelus fuscoguttatus TaxID=293821 RepID=UPI0020D1A578|nr:cilia- and flagella-associated protein 157-like [Epinephelus fuscoguttatus]
MMADESDSDDKEMWLYLTQIQHLDKQLERCQLQCDELKKQNKDLALQYSILEKDKTDITEYLQHCVAEQEKKVEELTGRLEHQQQAVEQDREALKLQHSRQLQELQDQIDELCSESSMQAAKFEEQQELEEQLEHLMQQQLISERLQRQVTSEKEEQDAVINSLRKAAYLERLKVVEERKSTQEDIIKTKVSNIIQEERAQHRELQEKVQLLLEKSMDLWEDKDKLCQQEKDLNSKIDKLKDVDTVIQETLTYKTEAKTLTEKCQQLEVAIKKCSSTHQSRLEENETLRQRLASASEECRQKTAEVDELRAEIQRRSSRREQLEGILQEAAVTLGRMLTKEETSEAQCKILQQMLHSAEPQGPDSAPEESSPGQTPQSSDPDPARAETLNLATDPLFLMARYRLGDFGYIPPPMMKHKPAARRTGAQLRLSRKLCSQRTSSCDPDASTSADC